MNEIDANSYDMIDTLFDVNYDMMRHAIRMYEVNKNDITENFKTFVYDAYRIALSNVSARVYAKCAKFCVEHNYRA